jgi:serine/threonine protein kinase
VLDVIDGLEATRALGIIHRDVKPSNCFVDERGSVKIGDFGISKTLEPDAPLTQSGGFLGTPVFASPEQVRGRDVDFRSDIYSLGQRDPVAAWIRGNHFRVYQPDTRHPGRHRWHVSRPEVTCRPLRCG